MLEMTGKLRAAREKEREESRWHKVFYDTYGAMLLKKLPDAKALRVAAERADRICGRIKL